MGTLRHCPVVAYFLSTIEPSGKPSNVIDSGGLVLYVKQWPFL
jgi:hypothetical protein